MSFFYLNGATSLRLVRTCPRCKRRMHHWAQRKIHNVQISCGDCGHQWAGRFLLDEWRDTGEAGQ